MGAATRDSPGPKDPAPHRYTAGPLSETAHPAHPAPVPPLPRVVVLISGRGSNLRAVLECAREEGWPARFVAVISNRAQAAGLAVAREFGVPVEVIEHGAQASRESFDRELLQRCQAHQPDLVVLAGFMRILDDAFVRAYEGRLINIHPSLLPAFAGLHTHRRALQAGVKVVGATVHDVTPVLDHGPVILQAVVPVRPHDDEASLAERVLQAEHRILPMAVGWHLRGRLRRSGGLVQQLDGLPQALWMDP